MKPLLSLLLSLFAISLSGQQVKVNNFAVDETGRITIDFVINQSHSDREVYDVMIYSSIDNYAKPISYRLENVKAGQSKRASFSGSEQFGGHSGPLQLKLVAQATTFPIKVDALDKGLKIGKSNTIYWSDYHDSGPYEVAIYQGTQLKSRLATDVYSTSYSAQIPKSLSKGNYTLLITSSNKDFSSERMPVVLKKGMNPLILVGVAALAGGGAVLAGGGGGSDPPPGGGDNLPDPPGPPSGN